MTSDMANSDTSTHSGRIFLGLLAILFIGLKLTGHIAWSWMWVLAPLWGPWAVCAVILIVMVVVMISLLAKDAIAYLLRLRTAAKRNA